MNKTVVFTWGRFNPPTVGHMKLIASVFKVARKYNADYHIYLSHSQDSERNPLYYDEKLKWLRLSAPRHAKNIIESRSKILFNVLSDLYGAGYQNVVMVVGQDRIKEFESLINKYNGVSGRHGFYDFDTIEVVSAGDRDPDADDVTGMSASKLRALVKNGDFETFAKGVSQSLSDKHIRELYDNLRKNMRLTESKTFAEFISESAFKDSYSTVELIAGRDEAPLFFSPRMWERVTQQLETVTAWHVTDTDYIQTLLKNQGKQNTISTTTRIPPILLLRGLRTTGGLLVKLEGQKVYGSDADFYSSRTKEGIRAKTQNIPSETAIALGKLRYKVVLEALKEWSNYLRSNYDSVVETISKRYVDLVIEMYDTFKSSATSYERSWENIKVNTVPYSGYLTDAINFILVDARSDPMYGLAKKFTGKIKSTIGSILQRMVKNYLDGSEKIITNNLEELRNLSNDETNLSPVSAWNEILLTDYKVKQVYSYLTPSFMKRKDYESVYEGIVDGLKELSRKYKFEFIDIGDNINDILRLNESLNEERQITKQDLNDIEKYADKLFARVGIDVEFTKHFLDRVNDARNRKQITSSELIRLFKQTYKKHGFVIPTLGPNAQAVIKDMQTDINVPFVLNVTKNGELELVNKTVMRKKNFMTSNPELRIERTLTPDEEEEKERIVLKLKKKKSELKKRYGDEWKSAMYGIATKIAKQKTEQVEQEDIQEEAEYQGRKVTLNKPFRTPGESKKFGVYAKNDKGNVVLVRFGDPDMEINRDDDERRKSFRARHGCDDNPGPKWKAKYWSCRMWEKGKSVSDILKETRVKQDSDDADLWKKHKS